jgi:hypothetical protein
MSRGARRTTPLFHPTFFTLHPNTGFNFSCCRPCPLLLLSASTPTPAHNRPALSMRIQVGGEPHGTRGARHTREQRQRTANPSAVVEGDKVWPVAHVICCLSAHRERAWLIREHARQGGCVAIRPPRPCTCGMSARGGLAQSRRRLLRSLAGTAANQWHTRCGCRAATPRSPGPPCAGTCGLAGRSVHSVRRGRRGRGRGARAPVMHT